MTENATTNPILSVNSTMLESSANLLLGIAVIAVFQRGSEALSIVGLILLVLSLALLLVSMVNQNARWQQIAERISLFGMLVGILGMFQHWDIRLYENGFYVLAISTLSFIVVSHIPIQEADE